jgi:hypothetical protein
MMSDTPETRHQLPLRLRDSADSDAWQEFMAIYEGTAMPDSGDAFVVARRRTASLGRQHERLFIQLTLAAVRLEPDG